MAILAKKAQEKEKVALRGISEIAGRSKQLEKQYRKQIADLRVRRISHILATICRAFQAEIESLGTDYASKAQECQSLVQRNISLRNETDELAMRVA